MLAEAEIRERLERTEGVQIALTILYAELAATFIQANPRPGEALTSWRNRALQGLGAPVQGVGALPSEIRRHAAAHISGLFDNLSMTLFPGPRN